MKSKILILVLSLAIACQVLSVVDHSFITVYIHKDMQSTNANSELKKVTDKLGSLKEFDKTDITVNSVVYKIKEIIVTSKFGREDNTNVVIGNSFPAEEKKLTTTYNVKDKVINLEFIVKLDGQDGTFSSTFTNKDFTFVISYGKDQEAYSVTFSVLSLKFTSSNSNCKIGETKLEEKYCTEFFTQFIDRSASKINASAQENILESVKSNLPTNKNYSDKIYSRENSSLSIVFDKRPTTNPKLISSVNDGEAVLFRLSGNVAVMNGDTPPTFEPLANVTAEFENFLVSNGKYQYAIKQEAVNKSYSLVKPVKETEFKEGTDFSISTLSRVFPEITRNYARSSIFKLFQKTTSYSYANTRPLFKGVLRIELPKILENEPEKIELTYEFIPDIISLSAMETKDYDELNLEIINANSYIRYLQVSSNSGITDEFELRKWITPVLNVIYDQEVNKSPFAKSTKVEALFIGYKDLETYYNGAYIFSMNENDDDVNVETKKVQELKFLGQ